MLKNKLLSAMGGAPANYIEDVFSTWLYTGNGTSQTITNGIDLAGKGGLVWIKNRSATSDHLVTDTVRGANTRLWPNLTVAQSSSTAVLTAFNANGFNIADSSVVNGTGSNYASWTFREQPKFFDVVTYTGDGTKERNISHALGSAPGFVLIKNTSGASNWSVYHRSLSPNYLLLNSTAANSVANISPTDGATYSGWIRTGSSTTFSVTTEDPNTGLGTTGQNVNQSGQTYVAYLFAHNAGGFGLSGTDNVISCGSFTTDGSGNASVTLGYEPQWIVIKKSSDTGDWDILDTMRGWPVGGVDANLKPNTSQAESAGFDRLDPTATGFVSAAGVLSPSQTFIYIAIRRGPMKVPTTGTSVFSPNQTSGTTGTPITTGFPVDWQVLGINAGNVNNQRASTRLTGVNTDGTSSSQLLITSSTAAESATGSATRNWGNTGFQVPSLNSGNPIITWNFRRAPGFFDVVCYTGTGANRTVAHNLAAVPELMIVKNRTSAGIWAVYQTDVGATRHLRLNQSDASFLNAAVWNDTAPTSTVFTVGTLAAVNGSGNNIVAYLFASCPGVSKVGSYTGTGTTQTINCGFTAGSRFVLIKRTDSTGDWYVWDSARGIVAGNDPYLLLNSTAAEVTNTDFIDTASTGFEISSTAPAAINASGGTFIFLAIA